VPNENRTLNFIDLFAGAGGLSEGFMHAGYFPIAHVEMNPEACLTLKTRACYYHLKKTGQLSLYQDYLGGRITRTQLYSNVPESLLSSVINQKMSGDSMWALFTQIDDIMQEQHIKTVDIVVGGPPCQAYSIIGRSRKQGGMAGDPRNYLYRLYCRVLKKYQPRMFVFENVPGLLTAEQGKHFTNMKKAFRQVGYVIEHRILSAQDFGVLQNRQRVILIGWKKGTDFSYPDFNPVKHDYTVDALFRDLPRLEPGQTCNTYATTPPSKYLEDFQIRSDVDTLTWNTSRITCDQDREIYRLVIAAWNDKQRRMQYPELPEHLKTHKNTTAFTDRFKVVARDLPCTHTMVAHIAKDGHYFIHPDIGQARSITVREAARIQSFPDNFFFEGSRTSAFTQIGNAVPPVMARGIASRLKQELEK